MPRPRKKLSTPVVPSTMPKGFYLKKGYWYKRIHKPNPLTGRWELRPEATRCRVDAKADALRHIERREAELQKTYRLRSHVDPGKVTVSDLLDDYLASLSNEYTKKVNTYNVNKH